jgi:hypothetical protein
LGGVHDVQPSCVHQVGEEKTRPLASWCPVVLGNVSKGDTKVPPSLMASVDFFKYQQEHCK